MFCQSCGARLGENGTLYDGGIPLQKVWSPDSAAE